MNHLIVDTETTGFLRKDIPLDHKDQARMVQLGCLLLDRDFKERASFSCLVFPENWTITEGAKAVHGISIEDCQDNGLRIDSILTILEDFIKQSDIVVAHNLKFDREVLDIEFLLYSGRVTPVKNSYCTMEVSTPLCKLPGKIPGKFKWPKLREAYKFFFNEELNGAHDALVDCRACARLYAHLVQQCQLSHV